MVDQDGMNKKGLGPGGVEINEVGIKMGGTLGMGGVRIFERGSLGWDEMGLDRTGGIRMGCRRSMCQYRVGYR